MKKRNLDIRIHLTNRWLYTLIAIGILAVIGITVYAYGTSNPSVFGHSAGEIDLSGGVNGKAKFNGNVEIMGNLSINMNGGHIQVTGSGTPTLQNCGTSSIDGTDSIGRVLGSSTSISGCTLVFNKPFLKDPICVVTPRGNIDIYTNNVNTTTLSVTFTYSGTYIGFNYICLER